MAKSSKRKSSRPSPRKAASPKAPAKVKPAVKKEVAVVNNPFWNIWDAGKSYKVRMHVPGLSLKDIKVGVSGKKLNISSSKEQKSEHSDRNYLVKEYHYNSWSRSIELPQTLSAEGIEAKLKDGVLKLELPKAAKAGKS